MIAQQYQHSFQTYGRARTFSGGPHVEGAGHRPHLRNEKQIWPFFIAKCIATATVSLPQRNRNLFPRKNRCVQFERANESQTSTANHRRETVHLARRPSPSLASSSENRPPPPPSIFYKKNRSPRPPPRTPPPSPPPRNREKEKISETSTKKRERHINIDFLLW